MRLSVLIPVYNEDEHVEELIRQVAEVPVEKEIIVVDDCSSDNTGSILSGLDIEGLRVIRHLVNQGKGAAIRTAMGACTGDAVIIQDADLEYDPRDFLKLIEPLERGETKVVYGVRSFEGQKALLRWGNYFLTTVTNLLLGTRLHDMETCYKLMAAEVVDGMTIESDRFDIEPEITAKIVNRGYAIHEVPISYRPREEKKLSPWRDGWPALRALWKYRRKR